MKLLKKCVFCDCDAWFLSKNKFIEKIAICAVEDGMAGFFCGGGRKWGFLWISSIWIKRGRLKQSKWCFLQAVLLRPVQFELKWCPQSFAWPSFFGGEKHCTTRFWRSIFGQKTEREKLDCPSFLRVCRPCYSVLDLQSIQSFFAHGSKGDFREAFFFHCGPFMLWF